MHSGVGQGGEELRAKVADIEEFNLLAKSTPTRGRSKKRLTAVEKRVVTLEAKFKEAQNTLKRSINEAKKSGECATDAATQLAESVQRVTEVEESAKLATVMQASMERQVAR